MNREAVARARACLGARFRPQGRAAALGLDCVGVVATAWGLPPVRADYRLRARGFEAIERELRMFSARVAAGEAEAGDVLVVDAGRGQPHLLVLTPRGYLHADAGAGRVLEVPGAVAWPVRSAWRCTTHDGRGGQS